MSDVVEGIRKKLLERFGDGGIRAISRRFRIMDDNHSLSLSESEVQTGLADCGITLSNSESRRLIKELDTSGDGLIDMTEFLKALRGPLPKCRKLVIDKAWKALDKTGDGKITIDDVRLAYDASRNPLVLQGKKTEDEVLLDFLHTFDGDTAPDGVGTREEFDDYYAGVSANFDDDHQFVILVTKAWRLDQPTKYRPNDLKDLVKAGFQTSAYHKVDGVPPPPARENSAKPHDTMRFAAMISNDIDPYPIGKAGVAPKEARGSYNTTETLMNHKTKCFRGGAEVTASTKPFDGTKSTVGLVKGGLHDARGFVVAETTSNTTFGKGEFDDEVMKTFMRGKEKEREYEAARLKLASTPFTTPDPPAYEKSSAAHAPLLQATKMMEPAVTIHKRPGVPQPHSRMNNSGGSLNASSGSVVVTGGADPSLQKTLQQELQKAKEQSLPRGARKPTGASMWETTSRKHFAEYDCKAAEEMNGRFATKPVSHKSEELTPEGEEFVKKVDERWNHRNDGDFATEKSEKLKDRFREADVDHSHDVKGTFGLKNGTRQMAPISHRPREVHTGASYNQSNVVPDHFQSTNKNLSSFQSQRMTRGY